VAADNPMEIHKPLGEQAQRVLADLGYKNVHIRIGDGYKGWAEAAPFDAVIVTCAPEKVPEPLVDQLKDGGRMVIPVGERFAQQLYLLEKKNGRLKESATLPVRFVPMLRDRQRKYLGQTSGPLWAVCILQRLQSGYIIAVLITL